MINEVNINFGAKQLTVYNEANIQTNRFTDADFDQFLPLQAIIETACTKTPEQIEKETAAKIQEIDNQIAELQNTKEMLSEKHSL